MRHLISLVLGVILAPLIYVMAGMADSKLSDYVVDHNKVGTVGLTVGLAYAVGAGALYAVLVLPRLSPVGPVLAGLVLLAAPVWHILDAGFASRLPSSVLGAHGALQSAANPTLMIAAVGLVCTVFSPRRWRSSAEPAEADDATVTSTFATSASSTSPAYQPSGVYTPSYSTPSYSSLGDRLE
jgi:hypothetical protein